VTQRGDFVQDLVANTDPRGQAVYAATPYIGAGTTLIPLSDTPYQDNRFWGMNASIDWRTQLGTLTVLPAYRHNAVDYTTAAPGLLVIENSESEQTSIEARFASASTQPLQWILGSYYLDERAHSTTDYSNSQFSILDSRASLPITSAAAFGRLTYSVTNSVRISGGIRYTRDRKNLNATGVGANVLCPAAIATGTLACAGATGLPYGTTLPLKCRSPWLLGSPYPTGISAIF